MCCMLELHVAVFVSSKLTLAHKMNANMQKRILSSLCIYVITQ